MEAGCPHPAWRRSPAHVRAGWGTPPPPDKIASNRAFCPKPISPVLNANWNKRGRGARAGRARNGRDRQRVAPKCPAGARPVVSINPVSRMAVLAAFSPLVDGQHAIGCCVCGREGSSTLTTLGCHNPDARSASRVNRSRNVGSCETAAGRSFRASRRGNRGWRARYTSPIPLAPKASTTV